MAEGKIHPDGVFQGDPYPHVYGNQSLTSLAQNVTRTAIGSTYWVNPDGSGLSGWGIWIAVVDYSSGITYCLGIANSHAATIDYRHSTGTGTIYVIA